MSDNNWMKNDARKLSTDEQALLRRIAVQRVLNGESAAQVTRCYGLGGKTIFKWLRVAREKGLDALAPIPRTGRKRALSDAEADEVKCWIVGGSPRQYGFDFGLWTRKIVADLITDRFRINLSVTAVGNLLHRLELMPQEPLRRAYERDEEAVTYWKQQDYPKIKKEAKKCGAEIFWLDESAIHSNGPLQKGLDLKSDASSLNAADQKQLINAISVLSNRGGFWYRIYTGRFTEDKFVNYLKDFMQYRRKPAFIIMEGHPVHKTDEVREYIKSLEGKLRIFLLPPYVPDFNSDELVWNQLKHLGPVSTNPMGSVVPEKAPIKAQGEEFGESK